MLKKKLLFLSLLLILLIAILHYFALKLHWYFTFKWLDIPVHILSGLWISLTSFWIFLKFKKMDTIINYKLKSFMIMFFSVLTIGIVWEVFEFASGNTYLTAQNYWSDTYSDILSGFIGGIIGYFYLIHPRKILTDGKLQIFRA